MAEVDRRSFLAGTGGVGTGIVVSGSVAGLLSSASAALAAPTAEGYGPLVPDPAGVLDLPKSFKYRLFSRSSDGWAEFDRLRTGEPIPAAHDGMAAFNGDRSRVLLVRNHELDPDDTPGVPAPAERRYDPACVGGTTTVVIGPNNQPETEFASLSGTIRNCAGGVTPWQTWLSCEETEIRVGQSGATKDHGFVFEVNPRLDGISEPVPLTAMGRFSHEAVAVDPRTGAIYETEDAGNPSGRLYRFLPARPLGGLGSLRAGGTLQAMRVPDVPDLSVVHTPGTRLGGIEWIPVPDPLAVTVSVRNQVPSSTRIPKAEGAWWGGGSLYFVSSFNKTAGPGRHEGQVWRYDPTSNELELLANFAPGGLFDGPDNITLSPYGIFLCEDGDGEQYLVGVSADGAAFPFARNRISDNEFAGATFSPDRKTLFVNIQDPGTTLAITGPWKRANGG
ncbi:MAG: alkaline phosphatase PhoX [Pseudonocardiaceae bacterium]